MIRFLTPADLPALESLYPAAFPEEELLPLVRELLEEPDGTFSLGAFDRDRLVGHVAFTECLTLPMHVPVALLGPLAVHPDYQRQGCGTDLVTEGLEQLQRSEVMAVMVLGDPKYYGRFGFVTEKFINPPFSIPLEWRGAWQSIYLGVMEPMPDNSMMVPPPWQDPGLWGG